MFLVNQLYSPELPAFLKLNASIVWRTSTLSLCKFYSIITIDNYVAQKFGNFTFPLSTKTRERGKLLENHSVLFLKTNNSNLLVLLITAGYTRIPCLLSALCNLSLSTVATNYFSAEKFSSRIIIVSINQQARGFFSLCERVYACVCVCGAFLFRAFR